MVHHHLLQLISGCTSVGCCAADLSHSSIRGTTLVLYHLELSRSASRTVLRISYRDGLSKSDSPLNDVGLLGTDWTLNAIARGERNQIFGMGLQPALRR